MHGPVEKALLSFMRSLRSRKHALVVLALLGWVVLAESLLVVHRIDHTSAGHDVSCALCAAADHQAATTEPPPQLVVPVTRSPVVSFVGASQTVDVIVSYRSRAPPEDRQT